MGRIEIDIEDSTDGDEWRLEADGRFLDVRFSLPRAKEDFITEAVCRGCDVDAVYQLASAMTVGVLENEAGHVSPAAVNMVLAAPLTKSRFRILFSQSHMSKGLKYYLKKERISKITREQLEQFAQKRLCEWWIHEREHMIQRIELTPYDFEYHYDTVDNDEKNRNRIGTATWLLTGVATIFLGRELQKPQSVPELIAIVGFAGLLGTLTSTIVKQRLEYMDYKKSPLEAPAYEQMETGECLSDIFNVSAA